MLHLSVDRVLPHLQQYAPRWAGFDSCELVRRTRERAEAFSQFSLPPVVLLAESDPVAFLSTFLGAIIARCPLFLGNPDWQEGEWQQVFALLQPDAIVGRVPRQFLSPNSSLARPKNWLPQAIFIPTGGTSGKIKFAIHTWETLSYSVTGFCQYFETNVIQSFCVLPLFHVSGLMQFLRSFLTAGDFYYCCYTDLKRDPAIPIAPENYFISLVPTQLQYLLENHAGWLSRFQTVMLGGAPVWDDLLVRARAKKIRLALTYGMTETAAQIATLKPEEFLSGESSSGRVLPHAKIKIVQVDRERLAVEGAGILAIEAKSLCWGYYPEFLPRERFHLTDDLGYFDDRGYLHLLGRNSQKIITGGENVFPQEVEAAILETQLVSDVCAIGIPDAVWGEAVTAVYVPKNDRVSVREIESAIATRVSKFKQPKYWVPVDCLPRNDRGKINCDRVRKIALARLGEVQNP